MTGIIWTKFYWQDWLSDVGLRRCSLAARGLWMDMLCIAAQHDPIGYVAVKGEGLTVQDIARMVGEPEPVVTTLIADLERNGVLARDRKGTIYNRRMVADRKKAAEAKKNGAKGGNPSLSKTNRNSLPDNPSDNGKVKPYELEAMSYKLKEIQSEIEISPFPDDGSIEFSKWAKIARKERPGVDVDRIASAFRGFCHMRNIPFDRPDIEKTFATFASKFERSRAA